MGFRVSGFMVFGLCLGSRLQGLVLGLELRDSGKRKCRQCMGALLLSRLGIPVKGIHMILYNPKNTPWCTPFPDPAEDPKSGSP